MVAEVDDNALPYTWEDALPPVSEVLQLWTEVGNGLDKNQTVVWRSAVESLDHALKNFKSAPEARDFCERYMISIISILAEQQPSKIGVHERNCVQESFMLAVRIVALDLDIQVQRRGVSKLLPTLSHVFNKKKAFYKGSKGASCNPSHHHHLVGMPEVRLRALEKFRSEGGFRGLYHYLQQRRELKSLFPPFNWIHEILSAAGDAIPTRGVNEVVKGIEDDAILLAKSTMGHITSFTDDELKRIPTDELKLILMDLQRVFDRLVTTRRDSTHEFYEFWRALVLQLIASKSLPLKLFGWEQVGDIIRACEQHRPPPRSYIALNAGTTFANGEYIFAGEISPDGYARPGSEFSYVREIPTDEPIGAGKKLTLFRCTMRSQQKWWFLSEADEEQPGTDRDIDYYQHKAKDYEEPYPPENGWITCRNSGADPPPTLVPQGLLVPPGGESNTLEHQLAKWAIENEIVEQVLGDTTIHREVVSRSTVLIKFLASMCNRVSEQGSKYCLQASHLLFAWKTCTRKADAAVSLQVYQLLVSILPLCPSYLAIPLLRAVQNSLQESEDKRDYLNEVSEFCSALADGNLGDNKNTARALLSEEVREEILNLLWSVLTHPDASTLKSYDILKQYVTYELRVEPKGSEHRERFLESCVLTLSQNQRVTNALVDEVQALRIIKLFIFVLEACPRNQAETILVQNNCALARLVFRELIAYLERRTRIAKHQVLDDENHLEALRERLRIVRFVFGLCTDSLSADAVKQLWELCSDPADREAVIVFLASASASSNTIGYEQGRAGPQPENYLNAALTEEVCHVVFLELFCSPAFSYDHMGDAAYRSFQFIFEQMRRSSATHVARKIALDALWRMCLTVANDIVAEQAMKDLLHVYVSLRNSTTLANGLGGTMETMITDADEESFCNRIYQCLDQVQSDLSCGASSADLAAQRCLRILKAAIGESAQDPLATGSTLTRLSLLPIEANFDDAIRCLPHGMRGQASYRRIGIIAKSQSQRPPAISKFQLDVHPLETLASLKFKVAMYCQSNVACVKPVQINGRSTGSGLRASPADPSHMSLNVVPEDSVMDELGVVQGCEVVFVLTDRSSAPMSINGPSTQTSRGSYVNDLSPYFFARDGTFADRLYTMLISILESLSSITWTFQSIHTLVWDLLLAMPTDIGVIRKVKYIQGVAGDEPFVSGCNDAMELETTNDIWMQLLDVNSFDRSVYVLLTIDAALQPAPEALSILPEGERSSFESKMVKESSSFRRSFVDSGGFSAVVQFFSVSGGDEMAVQGKNRRGNAVALRILKSCLFGNDRESLNQVSETGVNAADEAGIRLLHSLSDVNGLLKSLTAMVVDDEGISSSTISDVLRFLSLLFQSPKAAKGFVALTGAEKFIVVLLLWDGGNNTARTSSSVSAAMQIRKTAHDLVLQVPLVADFAFRWLMNAIDAIDTSLESTNEFFDVLEKLVDDGASTARSQSVSEHDMKKLAMTVCRKLVTCPRPTSEADAAEVSTGVLCGCLNLLRALIQKGRSKVLREASSILLSEIKVEERWSGIVAGPNPTKGVFSIVSSHFSLRSPSDDAALVDTMGAIFDGFLSPSASTGVAICCDKESRRRGFDVVSAAAKSCESTDGYLAIVTRILGLVSSTSPKLRHKWGQFGNGSENRSRGRSTSKYSGLRNQGCTCYMNSVLQQLFMMPELRISLCSAQLPSSLRSSGTVTADAAPTLVGEKISLQWDNGVSYDALVEAFDDSTGMHTIRYLPIYLATIGGTNHPQSPSDDISRLPPMLADEFVLSEGRPGRETGVYEVVSEAVTANGNSMQSEPCTGAIKETEDESASRHLLEQVQRTFIHLEEGSKGRCFDPRALVEACACLKLEFDVWQQNDASEFATKLLDRLEISLKKWAPSHFAYMDHTFGMKQTKQKICKECGLKTNREEKLLNIDCQIRGKSDIHEALAAMTEVEIMEGSNKVYCDQCKKNTDTILRTAISTLPNMLILSLKRFDLDFTTFETVKLNSRCGFGQTLNMKKYTLEGLESSGDSADTRDDSRMETDDGVLKDSDGSMLLTDDEYEYKLAGVLVHAGVAQGGHYYSFIKDRNNGSEEKWYRFDDEDVTPFDPSLIESECFGGKVKKETKWPNGQVHTVEQEQFANALMLFYEKVKPTPTPEIQGVNDSAAEDESKAKLKTSTGYEAFEPDVVKSNALHRWQSFLFDTELQAFIKGMLGLCRLSVSEQKLAVSEDQNSSWVRPMVDMILTFVFDVLLYASDVSAVGDWIVTLEELLRFDQDAAAALVQKLAYKTKTVSANWLRTFLIDCPDKMIRQAAVRVFTAATLTYVLSGTEMQALSMWSQAWKEQIDEINRATVEEPQMMPCTLIGGRCSHEDIDKIGTGNVSSVGIIISFLNVLLDAIPRCWRFTSESFLFIRNLAQASLDGEKRPLQKPLVLAQTPARIAALLARERAPPIIRSTFPAASISQELANVQAKPESNLTVHVVPLTTNNVLHSPDLNNQRTPSVADFLVMFEALICMGGLPCAVHANLVQSADEFGRSRQRFLLSEKAAKALRVVFEESCAASMNGLGKRELELYLRRCGVDRNSLSPQKIHEIVSKYSVSVEEEGAKVDPCLSIDGFLSYYRDCVQTNDLRLRMDLHTFGFRPDLSRRSRESRVVRLETHRETMRSSHESVALDVAELLGGRVFDAGKLANTALSATVHIHSLAYTVSEPLMEYLVAATVYGKDAETLINRTLQMIYQTPNDWAGNEKVSGAVMILHTIACTPGEHQQSNISKIMLSTIPPGRNVTYGCGLLEVTRALHGMTRTASQYNNEVYMHLGRYVSTLRELYNMYPVFQWMNENRTSWSFIERDLLDVRASGQQNNYHNDYGPRDLGHSSSPLDHNGHSDSDMGGMNDSDDDEDSQFDNLESHVVPTPNDGPFQITVEGAGNAAVNGVYSQDGFFSKACRYTKHGRWKNTDYKFYIFQCNVSNNTKHWYISIVPYGGNPGTSSDIDFYTAPVTDNCRIVPPRTGWVKANEGKEPSPSIDFQYLPIEAPGINVELNEPVVDDEQDETQHAYV